MNEKTFPCYHWVSDNILTVMQWIVWFICLGLLGKIWIESGDLAVVLLTFPLALFLLFFQLIALLFCLIIGIMVLAICIDLLLSEALKTV